MLYRFGHVGWNFFNNKSYYYYESCYDLQDFRGGRVLLNNVENYGVYLAEALISPAVDTSHSQYATGITLTEQNIGKLTNAKSILKRVCNTHSNANISLWI